MKSVAVSEQQSPGSVVRHEAKYVIPPALAPEIREFVRPFVVPDRHAVGDPPEYTVTTLQLDSPDLTLYRMKETKARNRFKLRIRTYGEDGRAPIFLEVKRKLGSIVSKSRAVIPAGSWCGNPLAPIGALPRFRSPKDELAYLEFCRLVREIDARPVVLIRYRRESYIGANDNYVRVTFDRRLCYRPTREWSLNPTGGRWWSMDATSALNRPFPGLVLALKTYGDTPQWLVDLTERFNLTRAGFCKYYIAVRQESLFDGALYSDTSENCSYG